MTRSFRLTVPEPLERDIHEAVAQALDRLLLPPAFWFAMPVGHIQLSAAETARLARIGLKRGLPDIFLIYRGLVFCLELKRKGGKLSKTRIGRTRSGSPRILIGQEDRFVELRAAGIGLAVAHSVEEALAQVAHWGLPLRGRLI